MRAVKESCEGAELRLSFPTESSVKAKGLMTSICKPQATLPVATALCHRAVLMGRVSQAERRARNKAQTQANDQAQQ